MLLDQLKNFKMDENKKIRVFFDLEETLIDDWENCFLYNISKNENLINHLTQNNKSVSYELFSYAVFNSDIDKFNNLRVLLEKVFKIDFSTGLLNKKEISNYFELDRNYLQVKNKENVMTLDIFKFLYEKDKKVDLKWSNFYKMVDKETMIKTLYQFKPIQELLKEEMWIIVDDMVDVKQICSLDLNIIFLNPKKNKYI